eukprot:m.46150 g.46150  ORF g.46150 m.46150 type:complete len:99 (+) comp6726_c0_seq1:2655-2951(+)
MSTVGQDDPMASPSGVLSPLLGGVWWCVVDSSCPSPLACNDSSVAGDALRRDLGRSSATAIVLVPCSKATHTARATALQGQRAIMSLILPPQETRPRS